MKIFLFFLLLIATADAKDRVVLFLSKSRAFLNEPILAKYVVKLDKKPKYVTLEKFKDKNFYAKLIKESNITKIEGGYKKEFYYLLAPQATGDLIIKPLEATVSSIQEKTGFLINNTYKTKVKKVSIFSIPNGLNIAGNLAIKLSQENNTTKAKEPIYYKLTIKGYGNLDDIKAFKLPIKGATYFSDKPTRVYKVVDGKLKATFLQKFTVVANRSFKIEPITLKYFNTQTELEESISTKEKYVEIATTLLTKKEYLILFIGFILGALTILLIIAIKRLKKAPSNLAMAIKAAKNDKELYKVLLPYSSNQKLQKYITKLEENIYYNGKNRVRKKEIINEL